MRVYYSPAANRQKKEICLIGLTLAVIAVFCTVCAIIVAISCRNGTELYEDTYVVRRGDSLWSISAEFCPDGMNRQDWIAMVRERNGITGSLIRPGQRIVVFTAD